MAKNIDFGGDGEYYAYIIEDEKTNIPEYYTCVIDEECAWYMVYDDEEKTNDFAFGCDMRLRVYRAGAYGCIIQISEL